MGAGGSRIEGVSVPPGGGHVRASINTRGRAGGSWLVAGAWGVESVVSLAGEWAEGKLCKRSVLEMFVTFLSTKPQRGSSYQKRQPLSVYGRVRNLTHLSVFSSGGTWGSGCGWGLQSKVLPESSLFPPSFLSSFFLGGTRSPSSDMRRPGRWYASGTSLGPSGSRSRPSTPLTSPPTSSSTVRTDRCCRRSPRTRTAGWITCPTRRVRQLLDFEIVFQRVSRCSRRYTTPRAPCGAFY